MCSLDVIEMKCLDMVHRNNSVALQAKRVFHYNYVRYHWGKWKTVKNVVLDVVFAVRCVP